MSLNIRYITNGRKDAFVVFHSGVKPMTTEFYEQRDDIPESIRHYAPEGAPKYYGPDQCVITGRAEVGSHDLLNYFYPNHPNCKMPEYAGKRCIAESCKHAPNETWPECEYLDI
jgi:hypothetical protein